jgi:hypothetical protein
MRKISNLIIVLASFSLLLMMSCSNGSNPVTSDFQGDNGDNADEIIATFQAINPSFIEREGEGDNNDHPWWSCQSFFNVNYGFTVWGVDPSQIHEFTKHGKLRIRDAHCDATHSKVMVGMKIGNHPGHILNLPATKNITDAGSHYHGEGEHTWGNDHHYGGTEWELNLLVAPCNAYDSPCITGTLTIHKYEVIDYSPNGPVAYTEKNWEIDISGAEIH